jgi:2-aminoadipate transaminase
VTDTDQRITAERPAFARWLGTTNTVTKTFLAAGGDPEMISIAGGLPEPSLYPSGALAEIARQAILDAPAEVLGYGPVEGLPALRDALATRYSTGSLRLTRANVLVTTSGLQGLDLLGKALVDDGGLVAAQVPTYLGALDAWRPRNPRYRPLVLDNVAFDARTALAGAQFAYTVPNYSNPTGQLVPLATRRALVEAAHAIGTWLVDDDPYGGLLYDGEALPGLLELSARERPGAAYGGPVVQMGTLSKELTPGLRIGWIVGAPALIEALTLAKSGSDLCTSGLTQRVALAALQGGLVDDLQPRMVALYRERRDALCAAIDRHLGDWFTYDKPVGGMFVWAIAKDARLDTDRLLDLALDEKVVIAPSSVFDASGAHRRALRINFTRNPPDRLDEAARRLAGAVRVLTRG